MRLAPDTLAHLPAAVQRPRKSRDLQRRGIVHFGSGAFHRAHQAVYTDEAIERGDDDWGIVGVSLRAPDVAQQLNPQSGLYTVTERSSQGDATRVIACLREVLVARANPERVIAAVAATDTHIISFTITEKGYCRGADGELDSALADEHSVWRYLRDGFAARRAARLPGVTLLCCDNLADNGGQFARLLAQYLQRHDPALARWAADECTTPSTMVDRIVPATCGADLDVIATRLGMQDAAAVVTEPFSQWVIEDRFAGPRPRWETAGAQFVSDVRPHEIAKLRMLNGAHSMLAYVGLLQGFTTVHEAVADPRLRALAHSLMLDEAATTLPAMVGFDPARYAQDLLQRFDNRALPHRLIQIAMDGSQKIPQRWLETLAAHSARGTRCPVLLRALGAWIRFVRADRFPVDDPAAARLASLWAPGDPNEVLTGLFGPAGLFAPRWRPDAADTRELLRWISGAE